MDDEQRHAAEAQRDSLAHELTRLTQDLDTLMALRREYPELRGGVFDHAVRHLKHARLIFRDLHAELEDQLADVPSASDA